MKFGRHGWIDDILKSTGIRRGCAVFRCATDTECLEDGSHLCCNTGDRKARSVEAGRDKVNDLAGDLFLRMKLILDWRYRSNATGS